VVRAELTDADRLRGGVHGAALGEALGLPWAGVPARRISRRRLLDDVGPTGAFTAALLSGEGDPLAVALRDGWSGRRDTARRLGLEAYVVARLAATTFAGRPVYGLLTDHGEDWPVPFHGTDANDRAVLDALLAILHRHDDPTEGMTAAVRLGGAGTARLGALTGAILGCRRPAAVERVAWRERVVLPDDSALKAL
jgi:ADP-ribosylglycohydrolase